MHCSSRTAVAAMVAVVACAHPRDDKPPVAGTAASLRDTTPAAQFGLATVKRDGTACFAIPVSLAVGDGVTLVALADTNAHRPSYVVEARIATVAAHQCATDSTGVGVAAQGDSLYTLYTLTAARDAIEQSTVYFGVPAPITFFTVRGDTIVARLGAERTAYTFRSCASSEGLHFTVWSGAPLHSPRVWHRYFYLGYDVDRDCDPADFAPPG